VADAIQDLAARYGATATPISPAAPPDGGGRGGAGATQPQTGGGRGAPVTPQDSGAAPDIQALAARYGATATPVQGAQGHVDAFRSELENQGFLSSAWSALKSVPEMFGSLFTGTIGAQATQDRQRFQAIEQKGSYAQASPEDRAWVQDYLMRQLPFATTAYKALHGNVAGAAGDVVGQLPYMLLGSGAARGKAAEGVAPDALVGAAEGAETAPAATGGILKSRLNPTQQAAVDYLRANDVPLNAGTVTGNRFVKGAQALAANTPLGAGVAADAARATEAGLTRLSGELADQAHPAPATPESAGAAVSSALDQKIAGLKLREDEAYGRAWKGMNDPQYAESVPMKVQPGADPVMATVQMPVDVRGIKQQLTPFVDSMEKYWTNVDRSASAGYQAAKTIIKGPDFVPAEEAERGLSGLKTMARVDNPNLRNTSQGMAAGVIPDLQEAISDAVAKTGSDALAALQDGRASHASKMEIAGLADKLREEPVQAFTQATYRDDTGISYLRKIADQVPGVLPQIGRAYVENLFKQATEEGGFSHAQTLFNKWQDLGPQTKQLLYPNPGLRSGLDSFFLGAKMAAENPNPSGTALVTQTGNAISGGVGGLGLYLHNPLVAGVPIAYQLGWRAIAKLLYSPAGVRLLTGGLKAEAPGAAALRAAQILRIAGDDDVTPIPPGGGGPKTPPEAPGGGSAAPLNPSGGGAAGPVASLETGPHGPVTREFQNDPRAALQWVRDGKTGYAAIAHDELGSVGLAYGKPGMAAKGFKKGFGVSHIDAKRPGYLDGIIDKIRTMPVVDEYVDETGEPMEAALSDGTHRVIVSHNFDGKPTADWIITAYGPEDK